MSRFDETYDAVMEKAGRKREASRSDFELTLDDSGVEGNARYQYVKDTLKKVAWSARTADENAVMVFKNAGDLKKAKKALADFEKALAAGQIEL